MAATRVQVFASHPIASAQYRRLLLSNRDFLIVEEGSICDVGVFDGEHPAVDAVLSLAVLRAPLMRPLLVSSHCDASTCLHWLLRGVWGIVSYGRYEEELHPALKSLASGQLWVPASIVMQFLRLEKVNRLPSSACNLTEREHEILGLLLRRLSNKEIAIVLRISLRTVKFHVGNILHKLRATTRKDLSEFYRAGFPSPTAVLPVPQPVPRSS